MKIRTERQSILGARLMGAPLEMTLHEPAEVASDDRSLAPVPSDFVTIPGAMLKVAPAWAEAIGYVTSSGDGSNG